MSRKQPTMCREQAELLTALLDFRDMTAEELAAKLSKKKAEVMKWIDGRVQLPAHLTAKVAQILEVSPAGLREARKIKVEIDEEAQELAVMHSVMAQRRMEAMKEWGINPKDPQAERKYHEINRSRLRDSLLIALAGREDIFV